MDKKKLLRSQSPDIIANPGFSGDMTDNKNVGIENISMCIQTSIFIYVYVKKIIGLFYSRMFLKLKK